MKDSINVEQLINYLTGFAQRMNKIYNNARLEMVELESFIRVLAMKFGPSVESQQYDAQLNAVPQIEALPLLPDITTKTVFYEPLKFTDKEISMMPKTFRKEFRVDGCTAHIRKRCDDRYKCSYEIRYRRNGYNISVSGRTVEEAKIKFVKKLYEPKIHGQNSTSTKVPTTFNEFALFWFENFHKRKVVSDTYVADLRLFNKHLNNRFGDAKLKDVDAKQIQDLIDRYVADGKGRTAEDLHFKLNQIFKAGVKFGLITHNPVDMIVRQRHEREHGTALTLDEEHRLLSATAGTKYQLMFAVALYTGMRPNEYKTAEIHGDIIVARNSKRKQGKIAFKRIPIIKMLKPYLTGVDVIEWVKLDRIRAVFNEILPNHTLKDLRTTFYTHCVTCDVAESARDEMIGHDSGILKETYTDLPNEFLLQEAQKLVW